jgi:hypothetical protein
MATVQPPSFSLPIIAREDLEQNANKLFEIAPRSLFVFDSGAALPATAAADDLSFSQGTHGSGFPYVSTGDFKASSITRKARFTFTLPPEYVSDGAVFIRFRAGMVTTVAGTSCTIDAEAFKASTTAGATVSGSDLITTPASSAINSLTWSNIDFSVTQTGLVAGDELDVLVTIAGVDAATATAVIAGFRAFVGCTIRG